MKLTDHPEANYYAYPLDLCAEVSEALAVTKIYHLPTTTQEHSPRPNQDRRPYDTRKIQPPSETEYHPSLRPPPRKTTKPLQVTQPEGPSFTVQGQLLQWEGWSMRVGFNYREGLTLHDVRHSGRSLIYRISLAEMFVPYADPRSPYPRKAAFDLGNDGAGVNANDLRLGCDCLGHIKYFGGWHCTSKGEARDMGNVVCCHEQDDGILWKHGNFRTGEAVVARARVLVLQTVVTVSSYEYVFAFYFAQDGGVRYEVRATGILSTVPIDVGEGKEKVPFGTVVAPGVLAPYHQHLFNLRIDPAVDGHRNSLEVGETVPLPLDDPEVHNPFGMGYVTKSRFVEDEGGLDLDFASNRTFTIVNEDVVNSITGTPVGLRLQPHYSQMLLAHPSSHHARRSEFAQHAVWVTRYDDEDMFPAGRHTMQSSGDEKQGMASGIERRKGDPDRETGVRNEDIVVWHTFGSTHNPRIEDWPVMPAEKMSVGLKPVNFFTGNPGLDVAPSSQEVNKSVLVEGHCCAPEVAGQSV